MSMPRGAGTKEARWVVATLNRSGGSEILSLTPSKIRTYGACPRRYKLEIVDRRGGGAAHETSPALSFGNSLHAALEEIHRPASCAGRPVEVEQILRRHWNVDGYRDAQEEAAHFNRGVEALGRYVEAMGRPEGVIVGAETFLSRIVRVGGVRVRLSCKVDRLEMHGDGSLEILDYKTNLTGRVPTAESLAIDLATFVNYLVTRITFPEHQHVFVSQLNVLSLAKVTVDYDAATLSANKEALTALIGNIVEGGFTPRPSDACSWCGVQDQCPAFKSETDLADLI